MRRRGRHRTRVPAPRAPHGLPEPPQLEEGGGLHKPEPNNHELARRVERHPELPLSSIQRLIPVAEAAQRPPQNVHCPRRNLARQLAGREKVACQVSLRSARLEGCG